jgi:hypothetical protein
MLRDRSRALAKAGSKMAARMAMMAMTARSSIRVKAFSLTVQEADGFLASDENLMAQIKYPSLIAYAMSCTASAGVCQL